MNKALFNYAKTLTKKLNGQESVCLKCNASLRSLNQDYQFGELETLGDKLSFTIKDIEQLRLRLKTHGYDLLKAFPTKQSRISNAENKQRNEKHHSLPVSTDFVLLNSLKSINVNQQKIGSSPINSLGHYLNSKEIHSLEHKYIIMVENLSVMACLQELILPKQLNEALWLYRGDVNSKNTTNTAYKFFRRWSSQHTLICFADFDPKGLEIACTSGADYCLMPKQTHWQTILTKPLIGHENDWFQQTQAKSWLNKQKQTLSQPINLAYMAMQKYQTTYKQEHIISHKIALTIETTKSA